MNKIFKKIVFIFLFFFSLSLNVNAQEKLKIGLLVPMTGDNKELGKLIIQSTRIALKDKDSGLEIICQKLIRETRTKGLLLKLGAEGLIAFDCNDKNKIIRQAFPSLSVNPIDVSGAGDSLMAIISTNLCSGSSIMNSAAIGCCMSSIAVQNMGNKSISSEQVKRKLIEVLMEN